MADKMTLDFENNTIIWDTDTQKGSETYEGLSDKKELILQVLGYSIFDVGPMIRTFEDRLNGKISKEEFDKRLNTYHQQNET